MHEQTTVSQVRSDSAVMTRQIAADLIIEKLQQLLNAIFSSADWLDEPDADSKSRSRQRCRQDLTDHFLHLAEAVRFDEPELFLDQVAWAKSAGYSASFRAEDLHEDLVLLNESIRELLPAPVQTFAWPLIETAIQKLPKMGNVPPTFIKPSLPQGELLKNWLDALLAQDRRRAFGLITEAKDNGATATDIYDEVIVPSLYEVGRLWQTRRINEAQEHYCVETTSVLLAMLSADFSALKIKKVAVGFCVGGEAHSLGMRLALDGFAVLGWDTVALGANVPRWNMEWILSRWEPDVIAISATMTYHLREMQAVITSIRSAPTAKNPLIVVGGRPFTLCPNLWKKVGADLQGNSCKEVMEIASALET